MEKQEDYSDVGKDKRLKEETLSFRSMVDEAEGVGRCRVQ
jgi:hypothetical protein